MGPWAEISITRGCQVWDCKVLTSPSPSSKLKTPKRRRMGVGALGTYLVMDEVEHHRCGAGVLLETNHKGEIEIGFVSPQPFLALRKTSVFLFQASRRLYILSEICLPPGSAGDAKGGCGRVKSTGRGRCGARGGPVLCAGNIRRRGLPRATSQGGSLASPDGWLPGFQNGPSGHLKKRRCARRCPPSSVEDRARWSACLCGSATDRTPWCS